MAEWAPATLTSRAVRGERTKVDRARALCVPIGIDGGGKIDAALAERMQREGRSRRGQRLGDSRMHIEANERTTEREREERESRASCPLA